MGSKVVVRSRLVSGAVLIGLFAFIALSAARGGSDWRVPSRYAALLNPVTRDVGAAAGRRVYERECASCHGAHGAGDGKAARDLERPVPDLARVEIVDQTDGALFWKITSGRKPMPGFRELLSDEDRWAVTDYLRILTGSTGPVVPELELPEALRAPLAALVQAYLAVGDALASAEGPGAQTAAGMDAQAAALADLARALPEPARARWSAVIASVRTASQGLSTASELPERRQAYAGLSAALLELARAFGHGLAEPLFLFRAGDDTAWIQRGTEARSPYAARDAGTAGRLVCRVLGSKALASPVSHD